ncbi:hypothetical protein V8G54_008440 [Vigna mungo]|uniref:Uncharacterized protein n=1 Tax=Vigna mungo TaxID=3915 RepID=A0AAQ3P485_VIGMU
MPRRGEADRVIPNPLHDGLRPWVWRQRCFLCDNGASAYSFFVGIYERSGMKTPLIADDIYEIIIKNTARLDGEIVYDRDFNYDYFGFKTLERSFLLKVQGLLLEFITKTSFCCQNIPPDVSTGVHSCISNSFQCGNTYTTGAEVEKDLRIQKSILPAVGQIEIRADLMDAHLYAFKRSVLQEVLDQKSAFHSLKHDVLPYLVRSQLGLRVQQGRGCGGLVLVDTILICKGKTGIDKKRLKESQFGEEWGGYPADSIENKKEEKKERLHKGRKRSPELTRTSGTTRGMIFPSYLFQRAGCIVGNFFEILMIGIALYECLLAIPGSLFITQNHRMVSKHGSAVNTFIFILLVIPCS